MVRGWVAGLLLAVAALGYACDAEAATLKFTGTGASAFTFTMDSDPTPSSVDPGFSFRIDSPSVQGSGIGNVKFFAAVDDGALTIYIPGHGFLEFFGPQLYTGPESAPHFAPGIFSLTDIADAPEQLVVSATPIPAALPLFASALGALGLIAWPRRQRAQAGT